ncbi:MAG TPA: quinol:electron acceptor oxidoreductase subunit ActD [Bryobacteraceae bacterium]|nr:quinol:electron acceptor oxidoreductase subunit ActD [Bryobacteraceae bacterium]
MAKNVSVFGIYRTSADADQGLDRLKAEGFRNRDISVLFPESAGTRELAHERKTKAPEGTVAGAGTGAAIGGALGWLAGIGALAIPGMGPFVAAGPIMGLLSGIGVGGALGGFTGALVGLGMPEYEAKRYEGRIRKGSLLVSVHCDNSDWEKSAKKILEDTGAEDIASSGEKKADYQATESAGA